MSNEHPDYERMAALHALSYARTEPRRRLVFICVLAVGALFAPWCRFAR